MVIKRVIVFLVFAGISAALWFANFKYPNDALLKLFYTFLALSIIYLIFKLVFEEITSRAIKSSRTKYSFRKVVSILYFVLFLFVAIRVWVKDPQALLVAYGLVAAGVAISLQDYFKNLAGGIILFVSRPYSVGDRIEINGKFGDVIDIGVLYTTLMEMKEWVAGDQATGRLSLVPNGYVLASVVNNYTKDHGFVWDEITIPITYGSNWKKAQETILAIVRKETKESISRAEIEISHLEEKYYLSKRAAEPSIFMSMTDNWITFNVRYITPVRERRAIHNKISKLILEKIQASKDIKIASETLDIIGFPGSKSSAKKR